MFTTCIILLGTNLFWFTCFQSGMAHVPLFFLYAALIFVTIRLHRSPSIYRFIIVGLLCGLITTIRPSDIVCICIPIFYSVFDLNSLTRKWHLLKKNSLSLLASAIAFLLPAIPQLLLWKKLTGRLFYDSYVGQSFNWRHPHLIDGLFGFSNGWLSYTPLMLLALFGLFFFKNIKPLILSILVILPIYTYIIYSWYCYNYINGLGSRPMIHLYPLLAFPLAAVLLYSFQKSRLMFVFTMLSAVFFISINIAYSYQFARGDLASDNSNFQFNWQTMFKRSLSYQDLPVFDLGEKQPRKSDLQTCQHLGTIDYSLLHPPYFTIENNVEYPEVFIHTIYHKTDYEGLQFIKCSGLFYSPEDIGDVSKSVRFVLELKRNDSTYLWKAITINNKIGKSESAMLLNPNIHLGNCNASVWGNVYFFIKAPFELQENDQIHLGIWNPSHQQLFVKNISLDMCCSK